MGQCLPVYVTSTSNPPTKKLEDVASFIPVLESYKA